MLTCETVKQQTLIRVIDDDPEVCEAHRFLLESEGWQVRCYTSACDFLQQDRAMLPGCLLLDIRMPDMSGIELQARLAERQHKLPIIFISAHGNIDIAVNSLLAGAVDFLQKPVDDERLLRRVAESARLDLEQYEKQKQKLSEKALYRLLTAREKEVVELVAQGLMNKIIADRLGISEKTVQIHRGSACKKLRVHSAVDIARLLQAIEP